MEASENRLKELVHRRHILEKKAQLRTATLAEFSAVHEESLRASRQKAQEQYKLAKERNEKLLRDIASVTVWSHEQLREHSDTKSAAANSLREERKRYQRTLRTYQPLWKAEEREIALQKLEAVRQEQQDTLRRRQQWIAEEVKSENLKKSLEHERRELMIQLAREQKDKISSEMRQAQAEQARNEVEQVLAQELTNYHTACENELKENIAKLGETNESYILQSLQNDPDLYANRSQPAETMGNTAPLQPLHRPILHGNLKNSSHGVSTSNSFPMGYTGGLSSHLGGVLNRRTAEEGNRGVLNQLEPRQGEAEVNISNVSVNSLPAPHTQEPAMSSSSVSGTPACADPPRHDVTASIPKSYSNADLADPHSDKENRDSNAGIVDYGVDSGAMSSATNSPDPASGVEKNQQSDIAVVIPTSSPNATMHRSPSSIVHQNNPGDSGVLAINTEVVSPAASNNTMDEFSLSVPYSPSHTSPGRSGKGKEFQEPVLSRSPSQTTPGANRGLLSGESTKSTPASMKKSNSQPFSKAATTPDVGVEGHPGQSGVTVQLNDEVAEKSVEYVNPTPYTESWRLIQCAMAMKLLCALFEKADEGDEDLKRFYFDCVSTMTSEDKTSDQEYMKNRSNVGNALQAAFNRRESQLVIFGKKTVITGVLEVLQEKACDIMPIEIFNGIVTMDKLHKCYKGMTVGCEELFNTMIQHIHVLVERNIFAVDEAVQLHVDVIMSSLLRTHGMEADRSRINRKAVHLVKDAVLNSMTAAASSSVTDSPVRGKPQRNAAEENSVADVSIRPATAGLTAKDTHPAHPATAKKNISFNVSQFVSLDDDEFIVDDSPPQKPPPMKDLSMYAETPKPKESTGPGQGPSANPPPGPPAASLEAEEEEFDFL